MSANNDDIDALLHHLDNGYWPTKHAALSALIAERDALLAERNALRERVAELEAKPADRDLRERLVCAALTGLCSNSECQDPAWDALGIADATLAAMRKGESDGK